MTRKKNNKITLQNEPDAYANLQPNVMNEFGDWIRCRRQLRKCQLDWAWVRRMQKCLQSSHTVPFIRFFFFLIFFFFGTHTLCRSTHVNGALATFWRPVLSIVWKYVRPQLQFISLGLFDRLSHYYDDDDEHGQQNQYTTNSYGNHCTVTHICDLMWQRRGLFLFITFIMLV